MHMITYLTKFKAYALLLAVSTFVFTGCRDDDNFPAPLPETEVYELRSVSDPNIEGTATFTELSDGATSVVISLEGTSPGASYPAHIHANTAAEGGGIVVSLNPINGTTGQSVTIVRETDDGRKLSFNELMEFDGYINVHLSENNLSTLVAQGDIGQNALTGESKQYTLTEKDSPGVSGVVLFEERKNGEALATISLTGTPEGGTHPAHIHANSAAMGGGVVYTFKPVNGTTGMSMSNVAALNDGTPFGYEDVLAYNGYVNVHLSPEQLATLIAQGDIGANAK